MMLSIPGMTKCIARSPDVSCRERDADERCPGEDSNVAIKLYVSDQAASGGTKRGSEENGLPETEVPVPL